LDGQGDGPRDRCAEGCRRRPEGGQHGQSRHQPTEGRPCRGDTPQQQETGRHGREACQEYTKSVGRERAHILIISGELEDSYQARASPDALKTVAAPADGVTTCTAGVLPVRLGYSASMAATSASTASARTRLTTQPPKPAPVMRAP